jgi:large subunit ribosomal protein L25
MEYKTLEIYERTELKKTPVKNLRKTGMIPAVIYGNKQAQNISVNEKEFGKHFGSIHENTVLKLVAGKKSYEVLMKDYQEDILRNKVLHIDFYELDKSKTVKTNVPVHVTGTAKGVKEGGLLELITHVIEVECLPGNIPQNIEIDVTALEQGQSIHVRDLVQIKGVKYITPEDLPVVAIAHIKEAKAEAAAEEPKKA